MTMHSCVDCGLLHDGGDIRDSDAYRIALLEKETAIELAKISARGDNHVAEVEAEAAVTVAESQAEAIVEALSTEEPAQVEGEPVDASPVVVNAPIVDSGNEVEELAPPKHDEHQDEAPAPKKSSLGLW
jgi:hypothetical protein